MRPEYHWIRGIDSCLHVNDFVIRLFEIASFERLGGEGIAGAADKDNLGVPSKRDIYILLFPPVNYYLFCPL